MAFCCQGSHIALALGKSSISQCALAHRRLSFNMLCVARFAAFRHTSLQISGPRSPAPIGVRTRFQSSWRHNDHSESSISTKSTALYMSTSASDLSPKIVVRARHLLLSSKEMAETCLSQLQSLEDPSESQSLKSKASEMFEKLAETMSLCPSGKAKKGDLGWIRRGEMVESVDQVLFDTSVKEMEYKLVQSQFGWHIMQVTARRPAPGSIDVNEFLERYQDPEQRQAIVLIDCRETWELDKAKIPGYDFNLPMSEYEDWCEDVERQRLIQKDTEKDIVVMCHHGIRSAQFCAYLTQLGYQNVRNLVGGIDQIASVSDIYTDRY